MKKLSFSRSANKCETSSSLDYTQIKAVKTRWAGRLGDAKRALTTSSSTPCLVSTAPPPPKRAPSTTLTLRSKSMTAELEELGELRPANLTNYTAANHPQLQRTFSLSLSVTFPFPWLRLTAFSPPTLSPKAPPPVEQVRCWRLAREHQLGRAQSGVSGTRDRRLSPPGSNQG
uniref:Uncharacterized protein n=1 Tax=Poecilia latipinna TaxID=48699 RepID=A0A3B3UIA8_9TELE